MASSKALAGKVCIVTGATRGIGKGIALQLGAAGGTVYITGRTLKRREGDPVGGSLEETAEEVKRKGGECIPVQCDHSKDDDVKALFDRVSREQEGQLDLLVNNAFSGIQAIADAFKKSFWEEEPKLWDDMNVVGLRNHYVCSVYASKLMVPRKRGLIVNVSSYGGIFYFFNVPYGIGKEGCDRMAADCAVELKKHNVAFVSLWPGPACTEKVGHLHSEKSFGDSEKAKMLAQAFVSGETPEYSGLAIAHLAADPNVMKKLDVFCSQLTWAMNMVLWMWMVRHSSIRELGYILTYTTGQPIFMKIIPSFIRVPGWMLSVAGSKF